MKKICEHVPCGKKFEPKSAKGRFCSDRCKVAANRASKSGGKDTSPNVAFNDGKLVVKDKRLAKAMADAPWCKKESDTKPLAETLIPEWVDRVEIFCNKNNCTVDDLIDAYKNKGKKVSLKDMMDDGKKKKEDSPQGGQPYNRRNRKLGF
jgi:hypothetical protein